MPHEHTRSSTPASAFLRRWTLDFHNRTVLFRIGDWIFTTYAFIAGAAFATGFGVALWYSAMAGLDVGHIARLYLFVVVPLVLVGLRTFSILLEWRQLFRRPLQTLIKPGYMLHGGVLGGVVGLYLVAHFTGSGFTVILDGAGFCMCLGEAIARLGCYVYGCCWGRPTTSQLGVCYTSADSKVVRCAPHLRGVRIHPAQLYALVAHLGLFALFYALLPYMPFDGALGGLYFIAHSIVRIVLEHFRQDDRGKLWKGVSHTKLYAVLQALGGAAIISFGAMQGTHAPLDLGIRYIHVLGDPAILPWILTYGVVFGTVYGVHYKHVGSWLAHRK